MVTRIFDLLDNYQKNFSEKESALVKKENGKWISYSTQEYIQYSNLLAYAFLEIGFRKGDRVISISNNCPEWNFLDMALAQTGLVHVPLYPTIGSKNYNYIIQHCEPVAIFVANEDHYEKIQEAIEKHGLNSLIFTFNQINQFKNWSELVDLGTKVESSQKGKLDNIKESIMPEDLLTIIYTSGTTGTPKGVMLSHYNFLSNVLASAERFILNSDHKALSFLPINHVYERMINYQYQYKGISIYYAESMDTIGKNLKEIKPHGFAAVPRVLEKVYDKIITKSRSLGFIKRSLFNWAVKLGFRFELNSANGKWYEFKLKIARKLIFNKWQDALGGNILFVCSGGAVLQVRLERLFWAAGIPVQEGYGLTETSPIIAVNQNSWPDIHFGTVGTTLKDVEIKIANDGEILVKGPNIMLGYYKDPELTKRVVDKNGWFHTGDIGCMEEDKFLKITDRKKEIFKTSGGVYITPQVMENKLKESPFIDQVIVIGEGERFPAVIISPNFEFLKAYAKHKYMRYSNREQIISTDRIRKRFWKELIKNNNTFNHPKRIKSMRLVTDTWTPETGELSPTLKLKRKVLKTKYKDIIKGIYTN